MPYSEVPDFMLELQGNDCLSSKALQLLILTAARTSEVLLAQWQEIDREMATWTIPAERMKARREHRIPLSDAAIAVLKSIPETSAYLFPSRNKTLSNMALLQLMRGLGYGVNGEKGPYVPHGFRSSFRDWAGEVSSFPSDVCEMALAHAIANKTEAAYRRSDLFEKRRQLMQAWANYCTQHLTTTKGLSISQAGRLTISSSPACFRPFTPSTNCLILLSCYWRPSLAVQGQVCIPTQERGNEWKK